MPKKRFIITFPDPETDIKAAAAILGKGIATTASAVNDGIAVLSSEAEADDYEGDVLHLEGIGCSVATLTESQIKKLVGETSVASVEEDFLVYALTEPACNQPQPAEKELCCSEPEEQVSPALVPPTPWNIAMIRADRVWRRSTGRHVKVAIIDTGIDDDHPDLSVYGGSSWPPEAAAEAPQPTENGPTESGPAEGWSNPNAQQPLVAIPTPPTAE